jgi:hypothetical protein
MSFKAKTQIPISLPIRWSLSRAATEFGVSEERVRTGLKKHGIMPGDDDKWSSQQMGLAIFDPDANRTQQEASKTARMVAEAEKAKNEMMEHRGELVRVSTLDSWLAEIFTQVAQTIRHLPFLSAEQRQQILKMLHESRFSTAPQDERAA